MLPDLTEVYVRAVIRRIVKGRKGLVRNYRAAKLVHIIFF